MYSKALEEGETFRCFGNEYVMLLPRDETGCCEVVMEKVPGYGKTPPNAHATFNQVYVILAGEPLVTVGEEKRRVSPLSVVYIPKNVTHYIENLGSTELRYLYLTVWPDGIPPAELEGGWRNVYRRMIQEYADRGHSTKLQF